MLMKLRAAMRWDEKGFTLVELIVVMAILAILATLAVPRVGNVLVDSKFKAHNSNVELLTRAVEMYNAQEEKEFSDTDLSELVEKNYIKAKPELPIKGLDAGDRVDSKITAVQYTFNTSTKKIEPGEYKLNSSNKWAQ